MRRWILGVFVMGALVGCGSDAGPIDGGLTDGGALTDGEIALTCAEVGGTCDCEGGCEPGLHGDLRFACPQPCDECGGCSQWCCVPDDAGVADAATDADPAVDAATQ